MTGIVETGCRSFTAAGVIPQYARVKVDSDGRVSVAGLGDKDIGTAHRQAFAADDVIAVRLRSAQGTHRVIASEAFAAGAQLYTEANGQVQDTAATGSFQVATALEAASAGGDVVEALYSTHGDTAA